jgi:hypothetical protein
LELDNSLIPKSIEVPVNNSLPQLEENLVEDDDMILI